MIKESHSAISNIEIQEQDLYESEDDETINIKSIRVQCFVNISRVV